MLPEFFQLGPLPGNYLTGSYNFLLIALSYLITVCASYIALDIISHLRDADSDRTTKFLWICGGAFSLSAGIWSMQYIGLLAYVAPVSVKYDFTLTTIGMISTALLCGVALSLFKSIKFMPLRLICGGILLGIAIFIMHYISIVGLRHNSVDIYHDPSLFVSAIFIAIAAGIIALWLATHSSKHHKNEFHHLKVLSALFMGAAICGMHYTDMASLIFIPTNVIDKVNHNAFSWDFLNSYTTIISILTIGIALVSLTYKQAASNLLEKKNQELNLAHENLYYLNTNLEKNISERTQELAHSLARLQASLEAANDGLLVIDKEGKIINYNHQLISMLQLSPEYLQNQTMQSVFEIVKSKLTNPDGLTETIARMNEKPEQDYFVDLIFNGNRHCEFFAKPQRLGNEIIGHVISFRDISEHKRMQEQLLNQATHDTLTGLPNRMLLLDRLQVMIAQAKRTHNIIAVLFLDLDGFKYINDSLGHIIGDNILKITANRLEKSVRESDTVARLGGDEFIIILNNLRQSEDVIPLAQKLCDTLAKPMTTEGYDLSVTASIGISFYPKDGANAYSLLKNADTAMYRAKEIGRNNFQFYANEMNQRTLQHLLLEHELRQAVERNEFFLVYQPFFNLKTGKITGVEALLRWQHPERGIILPGEFIKLAEETGLIIPIGDWVLQTACKQAKIWQSMGVNSIPIAINLSGRQFKHPALIDTIKDTISKSNISPQSLEIEITESIIIDNFSETIKLMEELKQMGVILALDDFGTGYSSLSYLKRLPIDKLKIDQSFIRDLAQHPDDGAIIELIIQMGNLLNLKVLAEGVETEAQLSFLQGHGCDEAQGYFFSLPLNTDNCTRLLQVNNNLKMQSNVIEIASKRQNG